MPKGQQNKKPMGVLARIGRGSIVYSLTTLLQRGVSFFLLPVYTRYLAPSDYGILSVVLAINAFLTVFVMVALQGAMSRYYFLLQDKPEQRRRFWGTIVTFVVLLSVVICGVLLLVGRWVLSPVIGSVPFYPFVAIGIATVVFQPIVQIYLVMLQTKEETVRYSLFSLAHFAFNLALVITLVVFLGWKAEGPLFAALSVSILFGLTALFVMRKDVIFGIDRKCLKEALHYSLPLLPSSLSSQATMLTDRLFINAWISTAAAGLYNIGYMFGNITAIVTENVNRAYTPVAFQTYTDKKEDDLDRLRYSALLMLTSYCLVGLLISLFAKEAIELFTTSSFHRSYVVVPLITFGIVATGYYFVFSTILFFDKSTTKYVSYGTVFGAVANILLNIILIPEYGMIGAAVASLVANIVGTVIVAVIGKGHDMITWPYARLLSTYILATAVAVLSLYLPKMPYLQLIGLKALGFLVVFMLMNAIVLRSPFALLDDTIKWIRSRTKNKP